MHTEQRLRAHTFLHSRNIGRALFADPLSVAWLTGFAPPIQTGPNPFAGGPPLVWYEDGQFSLVALDAHNTQAVTIPVEKYSGYTIQTPIESQNSLKKIVADLISKSKAGSLGVELQHLPAFLAPTDLQSVSIDGWLTPLRMIKTTEELDKLRQNFALTDIAQAAARTATRVGAREIEVWAAAHSAAQQAAGCRVPFGNDCVVSYRDFNIGGWPEALELRPNDSLMVDLSTRWHGYWSDSCATYYVSEPTARQKAMHRTATEALEFAISLVKPGIPANEIDQRVRQFIVNAGYPVYPHHTGHGVGVSSHEEPRIVPYNTTPLESGMVVMLEPGIYFPKEDAVRLEDAVLVTATGTEVLTKHDKRLNSQ